MCFWGCLALCAVFMDARPVNAGEKTGKVTLNDQLQEAVSHLDAARVKSLLAAGADARARHRTSRSSLVSEAASDHGYEVANLLIQAGGPVDAVDRHDYAPIMRAAANGDVKMVRLLLEAGAKVNIREPNGDTPLMEAVDWGKEEFIRLLIEHGADLDQPVRDFTPLMRAIRKGNPDITRLLLESGANVNAQNGGALMMAINEGDIEAIRLLVKSGAGVNGFGLGESPLLQAANYGSLEMVQVLLQAGARDPRAARMAREEDRYRIADAIDLFS
jgi:ankyrin repeat protein